jgi:hypothetical protein
LQSKILEPPKPSLTPWASLVIPIPFTVRHKYHRRRPRHLGVKTTVTLLHFGIRVCWSGRSA